MKKRRWFILIQCRSSCGEYQDYGQQDWRSWRKFMTWPKTFATQREAQEYMDACFTFKGIVGRKLSASVTDHFPHKPWAARTSRATGQLQAERYW